MTQKSFFSIIQKTFGVGNKKTQQLFKWNGLNARANPKVLKKTQLNNVNKTTKIYQTGKIDSVIITSSNGGRANMVSIRNLKITPFHPIISFNNTDEWVYPKDLGLIKTIKCSEMYTFVINNRQSVLIEDFIFSTFGHGLDSNEVIQHNYFGSESVIEDLSKITTDPYGKIRLIPEMFVRGGNGKVCSIKYSWKYHNFMNVFYHASL